MVVDVHSHVFKYPENFSDEFIERAKKARSGKEVDLTVEYETYQANAPDNVRTIVFGGKAKLSGLWVDDSYVSEYVSEHPDRLFGFLSVDPTQKNWEKEMIDGHQRLGLKGIKLLPMYAGFSIDDQILEPLWNYAEENSLPVLLHTGTTFIAQAPLKFTFPRLIEPIALKHPTIKIILAHMSHPFEAECIVVVRKHENIFTDISALYYRPFQFYHSLMLAQEYGVYNKLLFGTDYPFTTVNDSIKGIKKLNDMLEGTAFPRLDLQKIDDIINRDSLKLLNIK
jgi:predicted TIM-barrel fold metal-dependent hydrolase